MGTYHWSSPQSHTIQLLVILLVTDLPNGVIPWVGFRAAKRLKNDKDRESMLLLFKDF
jgi:hypothetical protein